MFVIGVSVFLIFLGFVFLYLAEIIPLFRMIYFQWFGWVFTCFSTIFVLYRIWVTGSTKQVNRLARWKHLINYRRRDNEIVPVYGERAYPGESFIDVPQLGLIEFLGAGCFYTWGDKKVLDGLENINFTPDVRYHNFNHLLYELGYSDSTDVYNVLNGQDLELMGRIYLRMKNYDKDHGVNKLLDDMKKYNGKKIVFNSKKFFKNGLVGKKIRKNSVTNKSEKIAAKPVVEYHEKVNKHNKIVKKLENGNIGGNRKN